MEILGILFLVFVVMLSIGLHEIGHLAPAKKFGVKVTQYMIVTAEDVKQAYDRIQESLSNMLVSFRVPDITESSIIEVFPFEKDEVKEQLPPGNFRPVNQEEEI